MTATATRSKTVDASKIVPLGSIAGSEYVEYNGAEFVISAPFEAGTISVARSDLTTSERVTSDLDGSAVSSMRHRKLTRVATGTYAALVAKDTARRAKAAAASRPRPIDELAAIAALQAQPGSIVQLRRALETGLVEHAPGEFVQIGDGAKGSAFIGQRDAATDLDGVMRFLSEAGAVLTVTPAGKLRVEGPASKQASILAVARTAQRGIISRLQGEPLTCESGRHSGTPPLASVVIALDLWVCRECAS